eukprot:945767_1
MTTPTSSSRMRASCICIVLLLWLITFLCLAGEELVSFGFMTSDSPVSGTYSYVTITAWFRETVYQCAKLPNRSIAINYTCRVETCDFIGYDLSNTDDVKMLIQNPDDNAVIIESVFMNTNQKRYEVEGFCINASEPSLGPYAAIVALDASNPACSAEYMRFSVLCIDNDPLDCGPSIQLIYFDTAEAHPLHKCPLC